MDVTYSLKLMKTFMSTVLCFLAAASYALCQDTNAVFLPEDNEAQPVAWEIYGKPTNVPAMSPEYQKEVDAAISAGECRPAELDPEGHWGSVVFGSQLSIRTATNVFTIGQPMPVVVIYRNTTTNPLPISITPWPQNRIIVHDEAGKIVPDNSSIWGGSASLGTLSPMRQIQDEVDLQGRLNSMKPGIYKISVERRIYSNITNSAKTAVVPSPPGTVTILPAVLPSVGVMTNLSSGVLTISLVAPTNGIAK